MSGSIATSMLILSLAVPEVHLESVSSVTGLRPAFLNSSSRALVTL